MHLRWPNSSESISTTHTNSKPFCFHTPSYVFQPFQNFQAKQIDKNITNRSWTSKILVVKWYMSDFFLEMRLHCYYQSSMLVDVWQCILRRPFVFKYLVLCSNHLWVFGRKKSTRIPQTVPEIWQFCSVQYTFQIYLPLEMHLRWPHHKNQSSILICLIMHFETTTHTNSKRFDFYILSCVFQRSPNFHTKQID